MWDTIVLGSGISGLMAAAALAKMGQKVLVLEQHQVAGGMTHSFRRRDWSFCSGVHYLSGVSPSGEGAEFQRLLDFLAEGRMRFAKLSDPYDIVLLPGFEFGIPSPESAYVEALLERFPASGAEIEQWFDEIARARKASWAYTAARGMPPLLAWLMRLWRGRAVRKYSERTLAESLNHIGDPNLRAVLGARSGDYGALPSEAPLLEHALVTGAYNMGACYPVGGPDCFARELVPVIEKAGGEVRLGADVKEILLTDGRASGVRFVRKKREDTVYASNIVSTIGLFNTLGRLSPEVAPEWRKAASELKPGPSYIALYLGFEGEIAEAGASDANYWIFESEDQDKLWTHPTEEDAPGLFVSFPSLKDPEHSGKHLAEILAFCDQQAFSPWMDIEERKRPEDYHAFKKRIEIRLLAQFKRHFPGLASRIAFHELATPLSHKYYARTPQGSMYGLEMSARRLASPALNVRAPVPGLLLAGQDVMGAGVQAAGISGFLAAAAIKPALFKHMGG